MNVQHSTFNIQRIPADAPINVQDSTFNVQCIPATDDFISRLNDLIEQHYADPSLNVSFLADRMAISRSGLFAKVKQMADVTPNELIQTIRLNHAAQQLSQGCYTVSEVCYRVGFSSPSYFTKCFQKQFGVKPTEYKS